MSQASWVRKVILACNMPQRLCLLWTSPPIPSTIENIAIPMAAPIMCWTAHELCQMMLKGMTGCYFLVPKEINFCIDKQPESTATDTEFYLLGSRLTGLTPASVKIKFLWPPDFDIPSAGKSSSSCPKLSWWLITFPGRRPHRKMNTSAYTHWILEVLKTCDWVTPSPSFLTLK